MRARGVPSPPSANSPVSVADFWVYLFLFLFLERISYFCALLLIAKIMRCLQVVPILCRSSCRSIAKFAPTCYGFNFIDYKRKRVLCVARLIIMYRTEPPFTYPAWRAHGFQSGTVFPAQCTVRISRITHLRTRSPSRLCGSPRRFHSQQVKLPSRRPKPPCRGTQRAYRSMCRLSIPPKRICSPSGTPNILFSRAPLLSVSGIRKAPTQMRRCLFVVYLLVLEFLVPGNFIDETLLHGDDIIFANFVIGVNSHSLCFRKR